MNGTQHHPHLRKRASSKKLQPYPHPFFSYRLLDRATYVVAFLGPISTLPQLYTIFVNHTAAGVSPISWGLYTIFNFVWLTYGIVHKEKLILFNSVLWIIIDALVTIGALIY
jgi:uncharacterized protein with PQ loop repeat